MQKTVLEKKFSTRYLVEVLDTMCHDDYKVVRRGNELKVEVSEYDYELIKKNIRDIALILIDDFIMFGNSSCGKFVYTFIEKEGK